MQTSAGKRLFSMVVTLVCMVTAAVAFFQFVRPAYTETQDIRAQVIARQNFMDEQSASITAAQAIIEKYQSDTATQQEVSRVLPSQPDIGGALYQLNAIAGQYNIQLISTTAQTPQLSIGAPISKSTSTSTTSTVATVNPLGIATFHVNFNARYEDLKAMLDKLESNVRLMDVTSVNITQAATTGTAAPSGMLAVDLTVATYYQITTN